MIIIWHYRDLRVHDNPAIERAQKLGQPILPVYIHDPKAEGPWEIGGASKWWLHHSLTALEQEYQKLGCTLVIRQGNSESILKQLINETDASHLLWNTRFQPQLAQRDQKLSDTLKLECEQFNGNYLIHPDQIRNNAGKPYVVYTPFSKAVLADHSWGKPLGSPQSLKGHMGVKSDPIDALELLPTIHWDTGIAATWTPGREGAMEALKSFKKGPVKEYGTDRDMMAQESTSRLSPHLAFGEVSPREVWDYLGETGDTAPYLRQLIWREFGNNFLHHFPDTPNISWREEFEHFPWKKGRKALEKWQKGQTGYPIVDAAMRQLWQTGWMHNRARMIVGSFLVKDLHIHWIEGAKWFWDTLVDADLANNTLGWQWVAGSGPDAAPYFRIFNPILQGKKFDPDGEYVRRYVPELASLPTEWIHAPWEAPEMLLRSEGVALGKDYPHPMVDHSEARDKALEGYEIVKQHKS